MKNYNLQSNLVHSNLIHNPRSNQKMPMKTILLYLILLTATTLSHAQTPTITESPDADGDGVFDSEVTLGRDQFYPNDDVPLKTVATNGGTAVGASADFGRVTVTGLGLAYAQTFTSKVRGTIKSVRLPVSCTSGNVELRIIKIIGSLPHHSDPHLYRATIPQEQKTLVEARATEFTNYAVEGNYIINIGEILAVQVSGTRVCRYTRARNDKNDDNRYASGDQYLIHTGGLVHSVITNFDLPFAIIVEPIDTDGCPGTPEDETDISRTGCGPDQRDTDEDDINDGEDEETDDDNDGILDTADNCQLIANPDQLNTDNPTNSATGDQKGDVCDDDDDNDYVSDGFDNCLLTRNTNQRNTDDDTEAVGAKQGDACDDDDDGDEVLDENDICPGTPAAQRADVDEEGCGPMEIDTDCDGTPDVSDPDIDGDGVLNDADECPDPKDAALCPNNTLLKKVDSKGCLSGGFCFPVMGDDGTAVICL